MSILVYVVRDGKKIFKVPAVETLEVTYQGNDVASVNIALHNSVAPYIMRRCELLILAHGEVITVDVTGADLTLGQGVVDLTTVQLLQEWEKETIPVNISKKNASVKSLMKDKDFVYDKTPWQIIFDDSEELDQKFEYEFSREDKLQALDKAIEMTTGVMKRVPRNSSRVLELGVFGDKKQFRITKKKVTDISMQMEGSNIKNLVVPLADKSDGGASSLTLRDLLVHKSSVVLDDFPIIDTGYQVNTQAMNIGYDFPQYAPNHKNEYAVMDVQGIEMEDGEVYEGSFTANDLQPIQEDGKKITNADRIKATETLYNTVVRMCKNSRRQLSFTVSLSEAYPLPADIDVLDRIQFAISDCMPHYDECMTEYERNIYANDEWFYVTQIKMTADSCGWAYELTLSKDLSSILGNRVN